MRAKVLLATVVAILLLAPTQAYAAAGSPTGSSDASSESASMKTTRVTLPLASPQSLADVLQITEARGYPVQTYRFENAEIVGEYSPLTGSSPSEYLADFENLYGTQPQFVSVVVDVPIDIAEKWYRESGFDGVAVRGLAFDAEPASGEHIDRLLRQYREHIQGSDEKNPGSTGGAAVASRDWRPTQAEVRIFRVSSSVVYFSQFYYWDGANASTNAMNTGFGFEMEVNIRADSAGYQGGLRPGCAGGYKEQPFAKNYGWTWAALVNTGSGMSSVSSSVGAYADYNDISDPCEKNSMAIGFQSPWVLPSFPNGAQEVLVTIQAPRGVENSGYIGGLVQSVSASQCLVAPWMSRTDCMGVAGGSVGNRPTLGEWRNWRAPSNCWRSYDYGNTAPVTIVC